MKFSVSFQEESEQQLGAVQALTQQTLLSAFPEVTVSSQQVGDDVLVQLKGSCWNLWAALWPDAVILSLLC